MFDDQTNATRRLPVYLLLDTSSSMAGAKIQGLNEGVRLLHTALLANPQALDTVALSVITYSTSAHMLIHLTDLISFVPPLLIANGVTNLGAAFDVLNQSLDTDIIANSMQQKGDYKPLVFLLTDGMPTDSQGYRSAEWRDAFERLKARTTNKIGHLIVLGIGPDTEIDPAVLREVGDVALRLHNATPERIARFFRWVSQSVSVTSQDMQRGQAMSGLAAPPPPDDFIVLD